MAEQKHSRSWLGETLRDGHLKRRLKKAKQVYLTWVTPQTFLNVKEAKMTRRARINPEVV